MFNWIKKKWQEHLEHQSEKNFENYLKYIDDCCKKETNQVIFNFSRRGFKHIYSCLIGEAKFKIYIVVEKYDELFDDDMFFLLKLKAKQGIKIIIISCNDDDKFNELAKEFKDNVEYYLITLKEDSKLNNEIILTDYYSYWISDKNYSFKAQANFHDYLFSSKLLELISKIIKNAKNIF